MLLKLTESINSVKQLFFTSHCWLVLASRVDCSSLSLLRASIGIMALLVAAEADNSLVDQTVFRVLSLNFLQLRRWYSVFLAVSRLVPGVTAPVADKLLVVDLLALIPSPMVSSHIVVTHVPMVPAHERVQMTVHPVFFHRKVGYLF